MEDENLLIVKQNEDVESLLNEKVKETNDAKTAIDILATREAVKREGTVEKLVEEKDKELRNDAEAKRIKAETERIAKEVEKIKQEKEKEIAEIDKIISAKKKEVEQLQAESDKATTFFNSNKDILHYIGIREKKTLGTMQFLMIPATIIFIIVQVALFPLTLLGLLLETIVNIIGDICGAVKNNALKIIVTILVVVVLLGGSSALYYLGAKFIF